VSRAVLVNQIRPNSITLTANPFERVAYANRSTRNRTVDKGLSAQADIDLGAADLTSITAWRSWTSRRGHDWDATAADIFYRPESGFADQFRTFSQELRLSGETPRLAWLGGLFYAREDYEGASPLLYGADYYNYIVGRVLGGAPALLGATAANTYMPGSGQNDTFAQKDTTWAAFTNNTVHLTAQWDLGAGARYTEDSKKLDSVLRTTGGSCGRGLAGFSALAGAVGAARAGSIVGGMCLPWANELLDAYSGRQTSNEKEWSGTLKTSYRWTPEVMTYASYARGYKAGGFNFDRPAARPVAGAAGASLVVNPSTAFAPETVDAYELGAKTQWLDRSLTLNLTAFHQTYHDFQLNTFLGTSFIVESIPEVRSKGVEIELGWRTAVEGLTLQGGATYAQTEYGVFSAAQLTDPTRFAGLSRLPGSRLSFAPLWSASASALYQAPLGPNLVGTANLSAKYNSQYNTGSDLAPQKIQPAFTVVNARIGVGPRNGSWSAELWAMNLTDADYIQAAINSPLQGTESDPADIRTYSAFLGQPRTYGLTLRLRR
jgi:outer membrane receptor protein involved in Fe transport